MRTPSRCLALAALVALYGCSGDPDVSHRDSGADTSPPDVSADVPRDTGTDVLMGPVGADRLRFPVGSTFWLPQDGTWSLLSAPAANRNAVFTDLASHRMAFVPHTIGAYRFRDTLGNLVNLTAVDPSNLRFENYNYFPSRDVSVDGNTIWLASTLRPEILNLDSSTLAQRYTVTVGAWPVAVARVPKQNTVLVACRGDDSLTVVDIDSRRALRSIWVGDEPSDLAVTSDGRTAIVPLPNDREVVFVNLVDFTITARVAVGIDPSYITLNPAGTRAYVSGRRTGPGSDNSTNDIAGDDISEIDLTTHRVLRGIHQVGTTLGGLAVSPDGNTLYAAALRANNTADLNDENGRSFQHTLIAYALSGGAITQSREQDITRSTPGVRAPVPSPGTDAGVPDPDAGTLTDAGVRITPLNDRRAVSLFGLAVYQNSLWVLSEANDMALRFDTDTLIERERFETPGRPRSLALGPDGNIWVFGHQTQQLSVVRNLTDHRTLTVSPPLGRDPRPADVALGQSYFTGPGKRSPGPDGGTLAGPTWSCSSCHADGLTDNTVWPSVRDTTRRYAPRAFIQLEGTFPLGVDGYGSNVVNTAYTALRKVGITQPRTADVQALGAYLSSITPPPPANSLTERDGRLSPEALTAAPVFQEHCNRCHSLPVGTSRTIVPMAIDDMQPADPPSLRGAYRNGGWFRRAQQRSLVGAVGAMVTWVGANLSAGQQANLTEFVSELTNRDFFLLAELPSTQRAVATTTPFRLIFSQPVHDRGDNLSRVRLLAPDNSTVLVNILVDGRTLTLTPQSPLLFNGPYRIVIDPGFESESEHTVTERIELTWRTVNTPTLRLQGNYRLTYAPPTPGTPGGTGTPLEATLTLNSDVGGLVQITAVFPPAGTQWRGLGVIDGGTLRLPPMPLATPTGYYDNITGFEAPLADTGGDHIGDFVLGTERVYTATAPGYSDSTLTWNLVRRPDGM